MRRGVQSRTGRRRGVAGAWVVVAFAALAGAGALAVDLGQLAIAAQRCQDVADSAALAGAVDLPYHSAAGEAVLRTADANNVEGTGWQVECDSSDITFYGPGDTIGSTTLGSWAHGLQVEVHAPVVYTFARILGFEGAVVHRRARIFRGPVEGIPICTMWMSHGTPLSYGQQQNMLMADGPHCAEIPGSFGFLQEPAGCTTDWFTLLQGYGLTQQDLETSFVTLGDSVFAKTGVDVGHFNKAFESDQGDARLERAATGEWQYDTFTDYHDDNPRIVLVPMVSYVGGTGSNAEFKIEKFGAFWLEGINQGQKKIWGRFIEYDMPGGDPNSQLEKNTGVFATQLMP